MQDPDLNHMATLVTQVSANGFVLRSARHDYFADAFLFAKGGGFVLLERRVPKFRATARNGGTIDMVRALIEIQRANAAEAGAQITLFDEGLTERSTVKYKSADLDYPFGAAYPTPSGGMLLSGCNQGTNLIRYLEPSGGVGHPIKASPEGMQECSRFAFMPGGARNSVLLLASNDLWGVRILTIQYSP